MAEQKSIPPDLAAAFFEAVRQYLLWASAGDHSGNGGRQHRLFLALLLPNTHFARMRLAPPPLQILWRLIGPAQTNTRGPGPRRAYAAGGRRLGERLIVRFFAFGRRPNGQWKLFDYRRLAGRCHPAVKSSALYSPMDRVDPCDRFGFFH